MADIIIEVQTILPATDWFFGKPYLRSAPLADYEPVVVFVQVTAINTEFPTLGPKKLVLPVGIHDYSSISDLVGTDASKLETEIFYKTQFEAPDDE